MDIAIAEERLTTTAPLLKANYEIALESGRKLFYSPGLSTLIDETGQNVTTNHIGFQFGPKKFKALKSFGPDSPLGKSTNPKKIKISLGMKCNFSCSYCSQSAARAEKRKETRSTAEEYVKKTLGNFNMNEDIKIEFWGGEPLLYWSYLKEVALEIRKVAPRAQFSMITNGSMLTMDHVDWLEQMQFNVAVSNDGDGPEGMRGRDPLREPKPLAAIRDLAFRLGDKFSFNCVLTEKNHSLRQIYAKIALNLGFFNFKLNTEGLVSIYQDQRKDLLNQDRLGPIARSIYAELISLDMNGEPFINSLPSIQHLLRDFFQSLQQQRPSTALGQKCGMDREDTVAVDLKGDVHTCQNVVGEAPHKIGNVADIAAVKLTTAKHWSRFDRCNSCALVQVCKGSCMYLDGPLRKQTCDGHFAFNSAVFAAAISVLTGERVLAIRGERLRDENVKEFLFS